MQFPGAVRSFPHPCGGRIVPKNREEVRKRFAHQPNGVPCGVFLHTFLHRLWKSFALLCGKWERERGLAPAWLASPCRCCPRRGAWRFWSPVDFAAVVPEGGACLLCRLPTLPLAFFSTPYPPAPPSPAGKGETQSLFRRGLRPRHPGTEPLAALTEPAKQVPGGGELARRCRLPPPPSPAGWLAFFVACLPCLQFIFLPPIPPPALVERSSPAGKGETKVISCKGLRPLHPQG